MNTERPMGGVMRPISTASTVTMPNQIRLTSKPFRSGRNIGTLSGGTGACLSGNRIRRNGGAAIALGAPMPGLWREGNREEWSAA